MSKYVSTFSVLLVLSIISCGTSDIKEQDMNAPSESRRWMQFDSSRMALIESIRQENQLLAQDSPAVLLEVVLDLGGMESNATYWISGYKLLEAQAVALSDSISWRKRFICKDGMPIYGTIQKWEKIPENKAFLRNYFADESGLYYAEEKAFDLLPDEEPRAGYDLPFHPSAKSKEMLSQEFQKEWTELINPILHKLKPEN